MLDSFNATIGKLSPESDLWIGSLGKYGPCDCHSAGGKFLELCTINWHTVINITLLQIDTFTTTMHPANKQNIGLCIGVGGKGKDRG